MMQLTPLLDSDAACSVDGHLGPRSVDRHPHILAAHHRAPAAAAPVVGASDAFHRELVALLPELRARALRLTSNGSRADDLVHDTVERALRFAHQFDPGTHFRAWIHTILFSIFVSRSRRSRRERRALERFCLDPSASSGLACEPSCRALSPAVARALLALSPAFRDAVEWVDLDGISYRDAAIRAGVPVGTIMSRVHRGRRILAEALTERVATGEASTVPRSPRARAVGSRAHGVSQVAA